MNLQAKRQEQKSYRITPTLSTTWPAKTQTRCHTPAPWQGSRMGTLAAWVCLQVRHQFRTAGHLVTTVQIQELLTSVALHQAGCTCRLVCPVNAQHLRVAHAQQGQIVEAAKRGMAAEKHREPGM